MLYTRKDNIVKLFLLTEAPKPKKDGPIHKFGYENWHTDKRPRILYLGKWRHPKTKNMLIGGINLNKLNAKELATIQSKLSQIYPPNYRSSFYTIAGMKGIGSLKANYDRLKSVAPWIIESRRYQTWDKKYVHSVTTDTLEFIDPNEIDDQADEIDAKHPAYAEPRSKEQDLGSDAATKKLVAVKPKEPSNKPKSTKEPPASPSKPDLSEPAKKPKPTPEPAQPMPAKEAPSNPQANNPQANINPPKEKELPNPPPIPSTPGFKVSASAKDIAEINKTKKIPTAGGVVNKPKTITGQAVRTPGNRRPGASSSLASRIKRR